MPDISDGIRSLSLMHTNTKDHETRSEVQNNKQCHSPYEGNDGNGYCGGLLVPCVLFDILI